MSGPPAVDSPLTRAGTAENCPFSGYPATIALSPRFAVAVANRSGGAVRPGTYSTARSTCGSNRTTVAGSTSPLGVTTPRSASTPATTCALVSTWPGEITKPEPSIVSEHVVAVPLIFTMLRLSPASAAELSTTWVGSGSPAPDCAPMASNTCAYKPFDIRLRNCGNMGRYRALRGITLSTVRSTAELLTWRETPGNCGELRTNDPMTQATMTTATTFTAAPPSESAKVSWRPLSRDRTVTPIPEAMSMPITAVKNTARKARNARHDALDASAREMAGAM